jgi:hypothetical protein
MKDAQYIIRFGVMHVLIVVAISALTQSQGVLPQQLPGVSCADSTHRTIAKS